MKSSLKALIVSASFVIPMVHAEVPSTPAGDRQVPNLDSDQMKVPEPVYRTDGEHQGALRFDGMNIQRESIRSATRPASTPSMSVRQAQEHLNRFGYDLSVDGQMGPETQTALREFQMSTGLMTTGRLNETTIDALRAQSAETYERAPASVEEKANRIGDPRINNGELIK